MKSQIFSTNRSKCHYSRREWMLELCETMLEFYPKEIGKIEARIEYFRKVKQRWQAKAE